VYSGNSLLNGYWLEMMYARQGRIARPRYKRYTVCNAIPDCQMIDDFPRMPERKLSKGDKRETQRREGRRRRRRRRRKGEGKQDGRCMGARPSNGDKEIIHHVSERLR